MQDKKKITLRQATPHDFLEWTTLRKKLWPEASPDELKEAEHLLTQENFACFLAEYDSNCIGFMEINTRPYVNGCDTSPVAFIEGLWIEEAFQKQGIGYLLVKQAEAWAARRAIKELASDTALKT